MAVIDEKKKIFGNIGALKTLSDGMPKLNLGSSFPSINNNGNSVTFLTDLLKTLIGYEKLKKVISDTLTYNTKDIEKEIKFALKTELKSIVSCGVNPSLPTWIRSGGSGIRIKLNKIDYSNLMLLDPNSEPGKLIYTDTTSGINSSDFNTFLYETIQLGTQQSWRQILNIQFDQNGTPTNSLVIKANPAYNSKTLNDLNNDFIDSIKLFDVENIFSNLIDSVLGTISSTANKTFTQFQNDLKVGAVIDKIANADIGDKINDSYFALSNVENEIIETKAKFNKKGETQVNTNKESKTKVKFETVKSGFNNIKQSSGNILQQKTAIENSINSVAKDFSSFTNNPIDIETIKLDFIQELLNNLTRVLVNSILSPKIIIIFLVNFKIIYGQNADFSDPIDFLKQNKNLVNNVIKSIKAIILKILLKIALKEITELIAKTQLKKIVEKSKARQAQILSLLGTPQDVTRKLKGLL